MRLRHPAAETGKKIVAVVGGGFGGLNVTKALSNHSDVFVILIDQKNHHLFQPLLYQVATAGLNPSDIAVPIRAQFSDSENVEVHWGHVTEVNLEEKVIRSGNEDLELEFDYLVLACGAQHSYFGHQEWEKFAPGLKTLEQATEIRRKILSAFELAENELDPGKQKSELNFVIVGGGPTGVELAGAIADISRTVLVNDFKRIDPTKARVILIEAGPRVLASFDEKLSQKTAKDLQDLGVEIRTSSRVTEITEEGVRTGNEFIASKTVIWAAGVQASKIAIFPEVKKDRAGRIHVQSDLSIPNFPDCFVIGDMAAVAMDKDKIVPGLAPAAIQEGKHAAQMILRSIQGQARKAFRYFDKGQMATIGKHRAVVQTDHLKFTGYLAWLAWLFVHILYLIGFRNRVLVLAQWAWNYLFSKRGSRLITGFDPSVMPSQLQGSK